MGWNSWNKIGCNVNEDAVKKAADAMVKTGMQDAGYQYIVIDDCWQISRDERGNILADSKKFPSGMKALADYVHSRGLKFGLYSDAGTKTCAGRPIVFSLCEWGNSKPWTWAANVGHLWRTTTDIVDQWEGRRPRNGAGIITLVDMQYGLESYAGPGHWNDPDMLEVGNGGMSNTEYRSHFGLWAILAAPPIAGNDLDKMTPETSAILLNKDVIAVDQDPLGQQGKRVRKDGDQEVYVRPLQDKGYAVVLLNRGTTDQTITLNWADLGVPAGRSFSVRDLWEHKELGKMSGKFTPGPIPSHSTVMIALKP
jgi:alpha-galactosidase